MDVKQCNDADHYRATLTYERKIISLMSETHSRHRPWRDEKKRAKSKRVGVEMRQLTVVTLSLFL